MLNKSGFLLATMFTLLSLANVSHAIPDSSTVDTSKTPADQAYPVRAPASGTSKQAPAGPPSVQAPANRIPAENAIPSTNTVPVPNAVPQTNSIPAPNKIPQPNAIPSTKTIVNPN